MFDAVTYNKSYQKDRRERLKAAGRCFDCGKVLTEADGGLVRCAACNAVHRAKNRGGTVLSDREKEYHRQYSAKRYAKKREEMKKLRAEGKCPRCKSVLSGRDLAFVYCAKCREERYKGARR